jgi:hypothetical protein
VVWRNSKDLQGSRHDPQAQPWRAERVRMKQVCCLGGRLGQTRYLEYRTDFWQQRPDLHFGCPRKKVIGPPLRVKLLSLSGL